MTRAALALAGAVALGATAEARAQAAAPLRQALLDAGIMRLRPVLITVGATVIALFPLASCWI